MRRPFVFARATLPVAFALALACDRDDASRLPPPDTLADAAPIAVELPPAPDTSRPIFEIDLWPGEGIPTLESVTEVLTLHRRPSPASPVTHELRVGVNHRLTYDSTVHQTMIPGRLRVLAPFNIRGRVLGNVSRLTGRTYYGTQHQRTMVPVDSTSRLEFLQLRAEGTCFVRLNRRVIDAEDCPAMNPIEFALEEQPVTRLWVRVVEGRRVGWLLVTDSTVQIVGRQY